jgi:hypothetical protein
VNLSLPTPPLREARLRAEFADRYPGIEPGVWFTAATLTEHLLVRMRREEPHREFPSRLLDPQHFEFRGEPGPLGVRANLGRRIQD